MRRLPKLATAISEIRIPDLSGDFWFLALVAESAAADRRSLRDGRRLGREFLRGVVRLRR